MVFTSTHVSDNTRKKTKTMELLLLVIESLNIAVNKKIKI